MTIQLEGISRTFGRQKVFKNINYRFEEGETYAVFGGNGSGKSTLLQIIFGSLSPSSGKMEYHSNGKNLSHQQAPYRISIAAPYLELIEELQALEFLKFYRKFREFEGNLNPQEILQIALLEDSAAKEIRNFSSGMKQRLRLALALCSRAEVVLLDEPVSNLDPAGVKWYAELIEKHRLKKTIIVGSNYHKEETSFCKNVLEINQYK